MNSRVVEYIKNIYGHSWFRVLSREDNLEKTELTPSAIYEYIKPILPESFLDEAAECITFLRKTGLNLTKFTITLKGDILSWSYNNSGLINTTGLPAQPDENILWTVRDIFFRLNFYQVFEFYEEHEAITWKHEIYKANS